MAVGGAVGGVALGTAGASFPIVCLVDMLDPLPDDLFGNGGFSSFMSRRFSRTDGTMTGTLPVGSFTSKCLVSGRPPAKMPFDGDETNALCSL